MNTFGIKIEITNNSTFTSIIYLLKQLVLKCDNTNTNGIFYYDVSTFNVLWCVQLGGRDCIISSTTVSKRESLVLPVSSYLEYYRFNISVRSQRKLHLWNIYKSWMGVSWQQYVGVSYRWRHRPGSVDRLPRGCCSKMSLHCGQPSSSYRPWQWRQLPGQCGSWWIHKTRLCLKTQVYVC